MTTEGTTPFYSDPLAADNDFTRSTSGAAASSDVMRGNDMVRRVAQSAHATIDRLAETAEPVVNRLSESVSGAGGTLQHQADHLREVGSEWTDSLRSTVRENPLAAVGVAVAVGVLVARLSR